MCIVNMTMQILERYGGRKGYVHKSYVYKAEK